MDLFCLKNKTNINYIDHNIVGHNFKMMFLLSIPMGFNFLEKFEDIFDEPLFK